MTEHTNNTDLTVELLTALLPEWQLALRAENKSPGTIEVYTDGTRRYLRWCESTDVAPMARTSLHTWMAQMLDAGAARGTVRTRQLAARRLAAWLIATGQLPADPFLGIKGPAQRHPIVTPLNDEELRALIATCTTPTHRPDEPLHHRRDVGVAGRQWPPPGAGLPDRPHRRATCATRPASHHGRRAPPPGR